MKKLSFVAMILATAALLSSCASPLPTGGLYTEITTPTAASERVSTNKQGTSECTSILGLVATGDCSIGTAARNGKITRISHVDYEVKNILGIYGTYKTVVYGD